MRRESDNSEPDPSGSQTLAILAGLVASTPVCWLALVSSARST